MADYSQCTRCLADKPVSYKSPWCKDCRKRHSYENREYRRARAKAWREANAQHRRDYRRSIRAKARKNLGDECARCGATEHLELDHVESVHEEREMKVGKYKGSYQEWEYRRAARGDVDNLQLLCRPCHRSKSAEDKRERFNRNT